jgi:Auxiliary Activity family 9 (formerly GH61)
MKLLTCILTLAVIVHGAPAPEPHYTFPNIIGTAAWADVRQWTGYEGNGPVLDVSSTDIRCNKNGDKNFAKGTITIAAGSTTGFNANQAIFHYGPALAYLAKVPDGKTAATWDGSGQACFKIYEEHPTVANNALQWPSYSTFLIFFPIPSTLTNTRRTKDQLQDSSCNTAR